MSAFSADIQRLAEDGVASVPEQHSHTLTSSSLLPPPRGLPQHNSNEEDEDDDDDEEEEEYAAHRKNTKTMRTTASMKKKRSNKKAKQQQRVTEQLVAKKKKKLAAGTKRGAVMTEAEGPKRARRGRSSLQQEKVKKQTHSVRELAPKKHENTLKHNFLGEGVKIQYI